MPFDSLGIWHDPGNGRFAPRGFSTLKALAFKLIKGGRTRDRVKRSGKGRARVADNMLSRAGIAKGDVIDVVYKDDDYAKVQITSKSGKRRWYDVQWARFDDEYVPDDVVDQPEVLPDETVVESKRDEFGSPGAHPITTGQPSYETARVAEFETLSDEDLIDLASLQAVRTLGVPDDRKPKVLQQWDELLARLNLDPDVFPFDSEQTANIELDSTVKGTVLRDGNGRGIGLVITPKHKGKDDNAGQRQDTEVMETVRELDAPVRVGSVVRYRGDTDLVRVFDSTGVIGSSEERNAAAEQARRYFGVQQLLTQLNPDGGIPVISTDDVFLVPPVAFASLGDKPNAYWYKRQPALVRRNGHIYLARLVDGTTTARNAVEPMMWDWDGQTTSPLSDTPENWAKARLFLSKSDNGEDNDNTMRELWNSTTVNADGTFTIDTGHGQSVTVSLDDAYRRLFDQVVMFDAYEGEPKSSVTSSPPVSGTGASFPWTGLGGSSVGKLPWLPERKGLSWWRTITGQDVAASRDLELGFSGQQLAAGVQYPPTAMWGFPNTERDSSRYVQRVSTGFKPVSFDMYWTDVQLRQTVTFANGDGETFEVKVYNSMPLGGPDFDRDFYAQTVGQANFDQLSAAWTRLGGDRIPVRTVSKERQIDGEWVNEPAETWAHGQVTSILPGTAMSNLAWSPDARLADDFVRRFSSQARKDETEQLSGFGVLSGLAPTVNRGSDMPVRRDGKITLSGTQANSESSDFDEWAVRNEVVYDPATGKLYTYKADGDLSSRAVMSKVTPDDVRLLARLLVNGTSPDSDGTPQRLDPLEVKDAIALLKAKRVKVDDDFVLYVDTPDGKQTFDSVDEFKVYDESRRTAEAAEAELGALGGLTAASFSEDAFREVSRRALRMGVDHPESKLKTLKIERNGKWESQGADLQRARDWLARFPVGEVAVAALMSEIDALPDDPMARVLVRGITRDKVPNGSYNVTELPDGVKMPAYAAATLYFERWRRAITASRNAKNDESVSKMLSGINAMLESLRNGEIDEREPGNTFADRLGKSLVGHRDGWISDRTRERAAAGEDWRQVLFGSVSDFAAESPDAWRDHLTGTLLDTQNGSWAQSSQSHFSTALQYAVLEMMGFTGDDFPEWSEFQNKRQKVNGYAGAYTEGEMMLARMLTLSTYTLTQSQLAEMGIDEDDVVFLARGSSEPAWERLGRLRPETVRISSNPLSANATRPSVANGFGGSYTVGYRVPRSRIFSTAHTGPGTYKEAEALVMGDPAGYIGQVKQNPDAAQMTALKKLLNEVATSGDPDQLLNVNETTGMDSHDMWLLQLLRKQYLAGVSSRQLASQGDDDNVRLMPIVTWFDYGDLSRERSVTRDVDSLLADDDATVADALTDLGVDLSSVADMPITSTRLGEAEGRAIWLGQSLAQYVMEFPVEERPAAMNRALQALAATDFTTPFYAKRDRTDETTAEFQPPGQPPVQPFNADFLLANAQNDRRSTTDAAFGVEKVTFDPKLVDGPVLSGSGDVLTRTVPDTVQVAESAYSSRRRWGVAGDATVVRVVTPPEDAELVQQRLQDVAERQFTHRIGVANGAGHWSGSLTKSANGSIFGPVDNTMYVVEASEGRADRLTTVQVDDPELGRSLRAELAKPSKAPVLTTSSAIRDKGNSYLYDLPSSLGLRAGPGSPALTTSYDTEVGGAVGISDEQNARQLWSQALMFALLGGTRLPNNADGKGDLNNETSSYTRDIRFAGWTVDDDGTVTMPTFDEWLRSLDATAAKLIADKIARDRVAAETAIDGSDGDYEVTPEVLALTSGDKLTSESAEYANLVKFLRRIYEQQSDYVNGTAERRALLQRLVSLAASQGKVLDVSTLERIVQSKVAS